MEASFSFGAWVRRRRKALDLTQAELAQRAGYAAVTIRKIEADVIRPSHEIAERLAHSLDIPVADYEAFLQAARGQRAVDRLGSPLPAASPPNHAHHTNLPLQLTRFVGRNRELGELTGLLSTNRLVTLTGVGGVGKTRLALAAADQVHAAFPDGIWLVELAPLRDADLVAATVASVLKIQEQAGQPMPATLSAALHDKHLLLILDNCEHMLAPCAELTDIVLHGCPRVHILTTSQTPLNLLGEQLFPIAPLAVPSSQDTRTLAELAQVESVHLFCERARAADPQFALTPANAPLIAEICRRLDGLPLTIELAAAYTRRFPPQMLLNQLREPLALLVGGPRNLPQRHQTLRATIDWSYQLLDRAEQELFARLSVFAGGWTLEAAEAITSELRQGSLGFTVLEKKGVEGAVPSVSAHSHRKVDRRRLEPCLNVETLRKESPDAEMFNSQFSILSSFASLLDKSLIRQTEERDGEPRFVMLETIQSYARERLASSGEQEALRLRHARYYLALAEQAEQELAGARADAWMDRLDQEHENLRAALAWALTAAAGEDGRLELAFRLCSMLCCFWWRRGYLSEGRHWVERVLGTQGNIPTALRAKVLHGAGILARARGDLAAAATLLEESLVHWRAVDDTSGIARALNSLGVVWFNQSDYERAGHFFEESLILHQALGETHRIALALNNLGNIAYKNGDLQRATERYEEGLSLLRGDHANQQTIALIKTNLGEIARLRKDYLLAAQLLHSSATIYHEINGSEGLILCLNNLVELAIDQDQAEFAAYLLSAVDALYQRIGAVRSPDMESDYQRQITAIQRQIQPDSFANAWNQGNSTPIDVLLTQTANTTRAEYVSKGVGL